MQTSGPYTLLLLIALSVGEVLSEEPIFQVLDSGSNKIRGTCFLVSQQDGLLMTAAHVVYQEKTKPSLPDKGSLDVELRIESWSRRIGVDVVYPSNSTNLPQPESADDIAILKVSHPQDLALLRAFGEFSLSPQDATFTRNAHDNHTEFDVAGYPNQGPLTRSRFSLSRPSVSRNQTLVFSQKAFDGYSGSPVFFSRNAAVVFAMVVGQDEFDGMSNFCAIPASALHRALSSVLKTTERFKTLVDYLQKVSAFDAHLIASEITALSVSQYLLLLDGLCDKSVKVPETMIPSLVPLIWNRMYERCRGCSVSSLNECQRNLLAAAYGRIDHSDVETQSSFADRIARDAAWHQDVGLKALEVAFREDVLQRISAFPSQSLASIDPIEHIQKFLDAGYAVVGEKFWDEASTRKVGLLLRKEAAVVDTTSTEPRTSWSALATTFNKFDARAAGMVALRGILESEGKLKTSKYVPRTEELKNILISSGLPITQSAAATTTAKTLVDPSSITDYIISNPTTSPPGATSGGGGGDMGEFRGARLPPGIMTLW